MVSLQTKAGMGVIAILAVVSIPLLLGFMGTKNERGNWDGIVPEMTVDDYIYIPDISECWFEVYDDDGYGISVRLYNITHPSQPSYPKGDCDRLMEVCNSHNAGYICIWFEEQLTCECKKSSSSSWGGV